MDFVCKVGTPTGSIEERSFSADSEAALRLELERKGFFVFSVRTPLSLRSLPIARRRIPPKMLIIFGQEMAALLKAGLPLFQALDVMIERQAHPTFKRSLIAVRDRVRTGSSLSDAFRAEGALYPPMFSASLVAGERSGSLELVLRRFVQYLRLNEGLKWKAISSAIYPAILLTLMTAVMAVLLVFVIPRFEEFYHGLGAELPPLTRVLVWIGKTAYANLLWIVCGVVGLVVTLSLWYAREGSAAVVDRILLRLPYIGHLMRMYSTSQLARTLSTLLAGGLPLVNALDVAAASIGNRAMSRAVSGATPLIREGKTLMAALESTQLVENLTLEMVKVGEQTGALGDMLDAVAEFYDEEFNSRMASTLALAEPLMIVLMAIVVAVMLLAFYLPLFESFAATQGRM